MRASSLFKPLPYLYTGHADTKLEMVNALLYIEPLIDPDNGDMRHRGETRQIAAMGSFTSLGVDVVRSEIDIRFTSLPYTTAVLAR